MASFSLPGTVSQSRKLPVVSVIRDKGPFSPPTRAGAEVVHIDLPLPVLTPGLAGPEAEKRINGEREVVRAVVAAHREGVREVTPRTGQHG